MLLGLLALYASPASSLQLMYASSPEVTIARGAGGQVRALCPATHPKIVGGGFEITRSKAVQPPVPYDNFRGFKNWIVSAYNPESFSGPARLQGFAICINIPLDDLRVKYPVKFANVPAATHATFEAVCPDKYKVVAGGYDIDGLVSKKHPFHIMGSFPTTDDGWAAEVFNPPGSPTIEFNVHAVCLREGRYRIVTKVSAAESLPRNSIRFTGVNCPTGFQVIGGGFDITGQQAAYPPYILHSYPTRGWRVAALNAAFNPILTKPANLRAFAVCIDFTP
jgi:hypothetical protein